jgi:hypothetical protein
LDEARRTINLKWMLEREERGALNASQLTLISSAAFNLFVLKFMLL